MRKRGTVIDERKYAAEMKEVARLIESPPERRVDKGLSEALGVEVVHATRRFPRAALSGNRGGRLAVAVGQYFVWHFNNQRVPRPPEIPPNGTPFYALFDLYWRLLKQNLQLDVQTAGDLVRLDMAGRGDTELRHALVKVLERNFTPPAPEPLSRELQDWGDELAVESHASFRKLAIRVHRLAGLQR